MNNSIKMLSPFVLYCQKVIPLAFDESMSYYECLCALYSYLKDTVVPAVNNNAEALEEVQKAMVELKDYVDNYFENLDVQDEINNKLDEMVEDGTFDVIFAQVDAKIGDLSSLTTSDKSSIVAGVNEVKSEADTNASSIGTLSNLNTTNKSNLVSAINEVRNKAVVVPEIGTITFGTEDLIQSGYVDYPYGLNKTNCYVSAIYVYDSATQEQIYSNISDNAGFKLGYRLDSTGCKVDMELNVSPSVETSYYIRVLYSLF